MNHWTWRREVRNDMVPGADSIGIPVMCSVTASGKRTSEWQ